MNPENSTNSFFNTAIGQFVTTVTSFLAAAVLIGTIILILWKLFRGQRNGIGTTAIGGFILAGVLGSVSVIATALSGSSRGLAGIVSNTISQIIPGA